MKIKSGTFHYRDQINEILSELQDGKSPEHYTLMVAIIFQTGIKLSELRDLTPKSFSWFKFKESNMTLPLEFRVNNGKCSRLLYITPQIGKVLRSHINTCSSGGFIRDLDDNIFKHTDRAYQKRLYALSFKSSPMMIRRSCIYLLQTSKWKPLMISQYLGLVDSKSTVRYSSNDILLEFKRVFYKGGDNDE